MMETDQRSTVFEIYGLPGAGKTTVATVLTQQFSNLTVNPRLTMWQKTMLRSWLGMRLLPQQPGLGLFRTKSSLEGFVSTILHRWHASVQIQLLQQMVASRRPTREDILLFDQGPVFYQTMLLSTYCDFEPNRKLREWIQKSVEDWAPHLGCLIWLDAPNRRLLERVHQREKPHGLRSMESTAANRFLDRLRSAYEELLSRYQKQGVSTYRICTESFSDTKVLTEVSRVLNRSAPPSQASGNDG